MPNQSFLPIATLRQNSALAVHRKLSMNENSQWCLVGNIVKERPYGHGGTDIKFGIKHFTSGTKVYCLPSQWGDGYDQIIVIGRHRGTKQFKTMIVSSSWVEN